MRFESDCQQLVQIVCSSKQWPALDPELDAIEVLRASFTSFSLNFRADVLAKEARSRDLLFSFVDFKVPDQLALEASTVGPVWVWNKAFDDKKKCEHCYLTLNGFLNTLLATFHTFDFKFVCFITNYWILQSFYNCPVDLHCYFLKLQCFDERWTCKVLLFFSSLLILGSGLPKWTQHTKVKS